MSLGRHLGLLSYNITEVSLMNKGIVRRDLSFLISAFLIVAAAFVATTGLVSDLWDLNDFFVS